VTPAEAAPDGRAATRSQLPPDGPFGPAPDPRSQARLVPRGGPPLLAAFAAAGVLEAADVHVARRLGRLGHETREPVLLAVALVVRAARLGAVCLEVPRWREVSVENSEGSDVAALPWPDDRDVVQALRSSPLVVGGAAGGLRPLHLADTGSGELLYLDRYFRQEQTVRDVLADRALSRPPFDATLLRAGLAELFPGAPPDRQRIAASLAVTRWTSIVAGGPGTGKTYTVASILRLLEQQQPGLRVALAAPTGKAAARLQEQVQAQGQARTASTLHRLLGWRPDSRTRFRHDAGHRLPYDVVVLDEASMVSLTLMARLLEALPAGCRLVLVGDPDQLASVDAGAVLADLVARPVEAARDDALAALVGPDLSATDDPAESALSPRERSQLAAGVVRLSRGRRFGGAIAELARAVRAGDPDAVMAVLRSRDARVSFVETAEEPDALWRPDAAHTTAVRDDVVGCALAVTEAARRGDTDGALHELSRHRLLCAHRTGPAGVAAWDARAREWVEAALGERLDPAAGYPGQPLLVTANDAGAGLYNGDSGVIVARPGGGAVAAFARVGAPLLRSPASLASVQTVYAMTIHRSQGSQYASVSVVLPPERSALLSRELLYTAVTRAQQHVRVIGSEASVRAAVSRQVLRASGLRRVLLDQPG